MIPYISHISDIYSRITDYARETVYGKSEISVGYPPLIGTIGESESLEGFHMSEPDIELTHMARQREELINLLSQGKIDCVFLMVSEGISSSSDIFELLLDKDISILPVMKLEHQFIGVPLSHPLASRSSVDISELEGETFVFSNAGEYGGVEDGYFKYLFMDSVTGDTKSKIRYMDFIDRETVLEFVSGGFGILPLNCLPPKDSDDVKFLKLYGAGRGSSAFFVYRNDRLSHSVKLLIEHVRSYAIRRS